METEIVAVGAVSSVPAETLRGCVATRSLGGGGGGGEAPPPPPPPPHALSKKNAPQPVHLSTHADIPISAIVIRNLVCQTIEFSTLYVSRFISAAQRAGPSPGYAKC